MAPRQLVVDTSEADYDPLHSICSSTNGTSLYAGQDAKSQLHKSVY